MAAKPASTWPPGSNAGRPNTIKLTAWVEEQIEETFTFYRLPQTHHKHLKSTNLLERFHQELKRRSLVVRASSPTSKAACG
jgi:transposase-like protein